MNLFPAVLFLSLAAFSVTAQEMLPPVKNINAQVQPDVFDSSSALEPLVISTREKAETAFTKEGLDVLLKEVNLEQQVVVLFAWRGSGQDRMEVQIAESFPEQVTFLYLPGRTRDLRSHVYAYAVRKNVKWSADTGNRRTPR